MLSHFVVGGMFFFSLCQALSLVCVMSSLLSVRCNFAGLFCVLSVGRDASLGEMCFCRRFSASYRHLYDSQQFVWGAVIGQSTREDLGPNVSVLVVQNIKHLENLVCEVYYDLLWKGDRKSAYDQCCPPEPPLQPFKFQLTLPIASLYS